MNTCRLYIIDVVIKCEQIKTFTLSNAINELNRMHVLCMCVLWKFYIKIVICNLDEANSIYMNI